MDSQYTRFAHPGQSYSFENLSSQSLVTTIFEAFQALQHIFRDGVRGMDATDRLVPTTSAPVKNARQRLWGDDLYFWISHKANQSYVRIEEWKIERNDGNGEANGLRAVIEEQNARAWHDEDPSLPLWRVSFIRWKGEENCFALVLSFHHGIVDGMASTAVVQAIVEESARHDNPPADEEILCKDLPPPMEDILDTVPRIYHIWRPLLLDLFPFLGFFLSPSAFSGRPKKQLTTHFVDNVACFELCDYQRLQVLRKLCRERNATIHAVLVAILVKAIAVHVDQVQSTSSRHFTWSKGRLWNGNIRFRINTPVNERNHCSPPLQPTCLGCCISTTDLLIQCGPCSKLSEIENQYRTLLQTHREESPMTIGLIAFISQDWLDFSDKRVQLNRGDAVDSIDASNIGHVSIESKAASAYKVKKMWMTHGRQNPAPALKASWLSTNANGINLVLGSLPQHFMRDDLLAIGELCQILLRMEYTN